MFAGFAGTMSAKAEKKRRVSGRSVRSGRKTEQAAASSLSARTEENVRPAESQSEIQSQSQPQTRPESLREEPGGYKIDMPTYICIYGIWVMYVYICIYMYTYVYILGQGLETMCFWVFCFWPTHGALFREGRQGLGTINAVMGLKSGQL